MSKPKVVFTFIEAGMGHIMPLKNIADCFEKKYGDKAECVRSNFFSDSKAPTLKRFEKMLVNQVTRFLKYPYYGKIITFAMELFGPKISTEFSMNALVKNATKEGVNYLNSLGADMVVSTHWATNYYAVKSKNKPLTVMYSPDNFINPLFRYKCDLVLTSLAPGYEKAKKLRRFNDGNLKLVDVSIRKEAFNVSLDKLKNRKKLGLPLDKFTIILAEGGYGIGKMEKICKIVIEKDLPVTLIPLCGKNKELFDKFNKIKLGKNTKIYPLTFIENVFEYIASSDLFCGKSGASMIAEPCYFGVPQIITNHATFIEKHNAEYYVNYVKSAINEFKPNKVVEFIENCLKDDTILKQMSENCKKVHSNYGSEKSADYIYELLKQKYPNL